MKNNERYNAKLQRQRIRRAKRLKRRFDKGESVNALAKEENVTTARIYGLIASVR